MQTCIEIEPKRLKLTGPLNSTSTLISWDRQDLQLWIVQSFLFGPSAFGFQDHPLLQIVHLSLFGRPVSVVWIVYLNHNGSSTFTRVRPVKTWQKANFKLTNCRICKCASKLSQKVKFTGTDFCIHI